MQSCFNCFSSGRKSKIGLLCRSLNLLVWFSLIAGVLVLFHLGPGTHGSFSLIFTGIIFLFGGLLLIGVCFLCFFLWVDPVKNCLWPPLEIVSPDPSPVNVKRKHFKTLDNTLRVSKLTTQCSTVNYINESQNHINKFEDCGRSNSLASSLILLNLLAGKPTNRKRAYPTQDMYETNARNIATSGKRNYKQTEGNMDYTERVNETCKRKYDRDEDVYLKRFYVGDKLQMVDSSEDDSSTIKKGYLFSGYDELDDIKDSHLTKRPHCLTATITNLSTTFLTYFAVGSPAGRRLKPRRVTPYYVSKNSSTVKRRRKKLRKLPSNLSIPRKNRIKIKTDVLGK